MPGTKGTRTGNSMQEYLAGLLQDVAFMQSLPDADLEYLTNLQAVVLAKMREPMEAAMASATAGQPPAMGSAAPLGGPGPMGGPPAPPMGGPMGLPPGPNGAAPGLPPGLRNGIAMPPVDELRRLVGAQ